MSIFTAYCLFAFTTALTAIYELLHPVMKAQRQKNGKVNDQVVIYITFFCISLLIAPVILFMCIVPRMGETFRNALLTELFKE